jgi:hypothetical protein
LSMRRRLVKACKDKLLASSRRLLGHVSKMA